MYTTDSNSVFAFQTHAHELEMLHFLHQSQSCYFRYYFLSILGSRNLLLWYWPLMVKDQMFSHE